MCRMQIAAWMMRIWAALGWKNRWVVATMTVCLGSSVLSSNNTWPVNMYVCQLASTSTSNSKNENSVLYRCVFVNKCFAHGNATIKADASNDHTTKWDSKIIGIGYQALADTSSIGTRLTLPHTCLQYWSPVMTGKCSEQVIANRNLWSQSRH